MGPAVAYKADSGLKSPATGRTELCVVCMCLYVCAFMRVFVCVLMMCMCGCVCLCVCMYVCVCVL